MNETILIKILFGCLLFAWVNLAIIFTMDLINSNKFKVEKITFKPKVKKWTMKK